MSIGSDDEMSDDDLFSRIHRLDEEEVAQPTPQAPIPQAQPMPSLQVVSSEMAKPRNKERRTWTFQLTPPMQGGIGIDIFSIGVRKFGRRAGHRYRKFDRPVVAVAREWH